MDTLEQQIAMLTSRISMLEALSSRIPQMESLLDEMDDDGAEQQIVGNWGGDGGGFGAYSSYFKVYDASAGGVLKIGVKDGGDLFSEQCGVVVVNGTRKTVDKKLSEGISADGCAWLMSYVTAEDTIAEIVFSSFSKNPDPPEGAIIYAAKLLGRWKVGGDPLAITSINQDYLTGGEHSEILWGQCEPEEV